MLIIPLEIKNCKPFTKSSSEICPSAHHPALFLTQFGIFEHEREKIKEKR